MGNVLKVKESGAVEFMHQNPLVEFSLPLTSIFPTIVAIVQSQIEERMQDAHKQIKAWGESKSHMGKSDKKQSTFQKPEKQEVAKSDRETSTYCLVYFNPETTKAEVVEESVSIEYEDETLQVVEEALAQRSSFAIFSFAASPIIREQVDEQLLQEIRDKVKIESPDPFGGGAPVRITPENVDRKTIEKYGDIVVALQIADERRKTVEQKIADQIVVVDSVVRKLELPGREPVQIIAALPPLSRARVVALMKRNKRAGRKTVRDFLRKDLLFLSAVRQKMAAMRPEDIFLVVKKMSAK